MKFVVPAKRSSTRVPDKNYREFAHGRSLLDILLDKLAAISRPGELYVSSEEDSAAAVAERHGATFLPRARHLADNSYPFQSVVNEVCRQLPDDGDDVMWCHATDPFFDQHAEVVETWLSRDPASDSVAVVYPMKEYLLDSDFTPIGFGFGPWHRPSQQLPVHYQLGFTCSIMTRRTATTIGLVGARPTWFLAENLTIDIDTQAQFDLAAKLYELTGVPERA